MKTVKQFNDFAKSKFFNSNYIYGGGVDTSATDGSFRDWAHTTVHGADEIRLTSVGTAGPDTDPL